MNKQVFKTTRGKIPERANTYNKAGGKAYTRSPEASLVQMALTGTFYNTFYCSGRAQLNETIDLCKKVDPRFVAQTAIYARSKGLMKDMPMFLCAHLAKEDPKLLELIFPQVMSNGIVLKKFVHMLRSGVVGRKSMGTTIKRAVTNWIQNRSYHGLFRDAIGGDVTIADIIKMVHPRPQDKSREAFYAYLIGKKYNHESLPTIVKEYEAFKKGETKEVPNVEFRYLTSLKLGKTEWTQIALNAPWHMCRMNLNTFDRHGVFKDKKVTKRIADKIRDRESIRKVGVFPYQLLAAYKAEKDLPREIIESLHDAMEIATKNVPTVEGKVVLCPDVSGSMQSYSVTGSKNSSIKPLDVAALVTAVVLRNNPDALVLPFDTGLHNIRLEPRDTVMTNANKLGRIYGGGTSVSVPMRYLIDKRIKADVIIYISDNESWADPYHRSTALEGYWQQFKSKNRNAKLICIDTYVEKNVQAKDAPDVLNIGGFSDNVFTLIDLFLNGSIGNEGIVSEVKKINMGERDA